PQPAPLRYESGHPEQRSLPPKLHGSCAGIDHAGRTTPEASSSRGPRCFFRSSSSGTASARGLLPTGKQARPTSAIGEVQYTTILNSSGPVYTTAILQPQTMTQ